MQPDLSQDPNVITQALLQTLIITLNGTAGSLPSTLSLPQWDGPGQTVIWVQSLLYASLACSLFAALGAVLGKQWLNHYSSVGERGGVEARGMDRQRKRNGIDTWHFRVVLEILPILLQMSLLLFGLSLCGYMWNLQRTISVVLIVANGIGALFYFSVMGASLVFPDCPYYTPLTRMHRPLRSLLKRIGQVPKLLLDTCTSIWTSLRDTLLLITRLLASMRYSTHRAPTHSSSSRVHGEQGNDRALELRHPLDSHRGSASRTSAGTLQTLRDTVGVWWSPRSAMPITEKDLLKLAGSDGKGLSLTAEAVVWLMQTSTDPFTLADAAAIAIPELTQQSEVVELLTCSLLDPILSGLLDCFETDSQGKLKPVSSSRDKALAFSAAFLFIYWERLVRHSDELQRWLARSGQYAGRRRERLVEALQRVRLDENYGTQEERGVLHLMYLTLGLHNQKADETDQPVSYLTFVPTTTTLEGLSCRTLFFLAQGSELHLEDPEFLASLLEVIKRYYVQATSEEARDVCFLSFASILGYKIKKGSIPDETLTPARSVHSHSLDGLY